MSRRLQPWCWLNQRGESPLTQWQACEWLVAWRPMVGILEKDAGCAEYPAEYTATTQKSPSPFGPFVSGAD
jgi:hypothetical protein